MERSNDIISAVMSIASRATDAIPAENNDYTVDGILHCGKCHSPKEIIVPLLDLSYKMRCLCKCRALEEQRKKEKEKEDALKARADGLRKLFPSSSLATFTIANDDNHNPEISTIVQNYCNHFSEMRKQGCGLIFYGPVGTGKTFYAAAIANKVLDLGYSAYFTSLTRLENMIFSATDKQGLIDNICSYDLLVIDELGAERRTEWSEEQVFNVIDTRYNAKLPLVLTTNLTLKELCNRNDTRARAYSRLLEMCFAYEVSGQDHRVEKMSQKRDLFELLRSKG